jgi:peptidyl-prolyl cis-trans isomerase A (cyclophilin A)
VNDDPLAGPSACAKVVRSRRAHHRSMQSSIVRCVALLWFATSLLASPAARAAAPSHVDIAIRTTDGTIVVRLDTAHAPITANNFLHYVDRHAFDRGASFYRTVAKINEPGVPFEVIQGGFKAVPPDAKRITLEPTNATGLHNDDGEIAMARTNDPDSAATEFFICIGNARYLDAGGPLGVGYAAFGKVIRGMDVVHRIHHASAQGESLAPPVAILSIKRIH